MMMETNLSRDTVDDTTTTAFRHTSAFLMKKECDIRRLRVNLAT